MNCIEFTNTKSIVQTLKSELELNGIELEASAGNATGKTRKCLEIIGANFKILDWSDREEMMKQNGLNVLFAQYDFKDRISPEPVNPGKAHNFDSSGALKPHIRAEDGKLNYTYSERMYFQYENIVEVLREKPETRQAFISVWNPSIDLHNIERERVPCSIGYHFLLRSGVLSMIYLMRSLEVSKCLGNDIFTSTMLLEYIANKVGCEPGSVQFSIGSMHIFLD